MKQTSRNVVDVRDVDNINNERRNYEKLLNNHLKA